MRNITAQHGVVRFRPMVHSRLLVWYTWRAGITSMVTLNGRFRNNLEGLRRRDDVLHLPPLWARIKVVFVASADALKHLCVYQHT